MLFSCLKFFQNICLVSSILKPITIGWPWYLEKSHLGAKWKQNNWAHLRFHVKIYYIQEWFFISISKRVNVFSFIYAENIRVFYEENPYLYEVLLQSRYATIFRNGLTKCICNRFHLQKFMYSNVIFCSIRTTKQMHCLYNKWGVSKTPTFNK